MPISVLGFICIISWFEGGGSENFHIYFQQTNTKISLMHTHTYAHTLYVCACVCIYVYIKFYFFVQSPNLSYKWIKTSKYTLGNLFSSCFLCYLLQNNPTPFPLCSRRKHTHLYLQHPITSSLCLYIICLCDGQCHVSAWLGLVPRKESRCCYKSIYLNEIHSYNQLTLSKGDHPQ